MARVGAQFTHPLALVLWIAAALAPISGTLSLAVAIVAVIVLHAVLAFFQERRPSAPPRR